MLDVFRLPERDPAQVAGPFWLTMVWNKGVSFYALNFDADWTRRAHSAFSFDRRRPVLTAWAWRVDRAAWAIAVGLIIGGAVGNAIESVLRPRARSPTSSMSPWSWFPWVFNVADSAINVGSVSLYLGPCSWVSRKPCAPV